MAAQPSRNIVAVVPAAGIGSRMQADKPKQYLTIHGKTILEHTVAALLDVPFIQHLVLVCAKNDPFLPHLALAQNPKIAMVEGGPNRSDSVLNGLHYVSQHFARDTWVMVHDAARPCVTPQDLEKLAQINDDNGAILAIPAIDTIKRALPNRQIACTEDRTQLWQAQTPQFFRADLLRDALIRAQKQGLSVTDEASAMELAGFSPHLVAGRSDNIKITRPEDLALAEFYLSKNRNK